MNSESSTQCVPAQVASVCMCSRRGHECIEFSSTVTPPERSQVVHIVHTVGSCGESIEQTISTATHYWKKNTNYTTQHTWASSFTDSHRVRKETLFHGQFSFFCHKVTRNSELCCTVGTARLPQMRLEFRVKEKDIIIMTVNQNEWMERLHVLT